MYRTDRNEVRRRRFRSIRLPFCALIRQTGVWNVGAGSDWLIYTPRAVSE
jgi:hypothetical protein